MNVVAWEGVRCVRMVHFWVGVRWSGWFEGRWFGGEGVLDGILYEVDDGSGMVGVVEDERNGSKAYGGSGCSAV